MTACHYTAFRGITVTPTELYNEHAEWAEGIARRLAPCLRKYGWEPDDAVQSALLKLWVLCGEGQTHRGYLLTSIVRYVRKQAKGNRLSPVTAEPEVLSVLPARERSFAERLAAICNDATGVVGQFLHGRLVYGWRPDELRKQWEWTETRYYEVRKEAAEWLLGQLEDRK